MRIRAHFLSAFALSAALAACTGETPTGLMATPGTGGARVVFDLEATPLPEIPLPNDLATRSDPTSATGRRVNISLQASTGLERKLRAAANQLEGFGTYAPISVRFEKPLDLDNIISRHRKNKDFADDAVYLVNLQPGPKFGQLSPLDFGHGNFPLVVAKMDRYWQNDPRRDVPNLLFDTTNEDKNGNGVLDPGEDTDGDGWLDVPNVHPAGADPQDGLLAFYEKVTNTLFFRPIFPLEQESLYAVVLMKRLTDTDGRPVRSPFPFINHLRQTEVLKELPRALRMNGQTIDDVAFTWGFTTMGPTRDLEALRRGLYGNGTFARLAKEFPPDVKLLPMVTDGSANPYILKTEKLLSLATSLLPLALGQGTDRAAIDILLDSLNNVNYFIMGRVRGPNLLADKDNLATPGYPADDDETWDMDRATGRAFYKPHEVGFWCAVPRKERGVAGQPFPVSFYNHGHTLSRLTMIGYAGFLARHGVASCAITAYGHGVAVEDDLRPLVGMLADAYGLRPTIEEMIPDRARDLDNDSAPDSAGDFFISDLFHSRDMIRQTVLDEMLVIRALRQFDGVKGYANAGAPGLPAVAGDFDGDGVVDIGGPTAAYSVWGHSLGGIMSAVVAGIEPAISSAVPICYAAGLADVGLRTADFGVPDSVLLRILGPIYVGTPTGVEGETSIRAIVPSLMGRKELVVAKTTLVAPGDKLVIRNATNKERYETYADPSRNFRGPIAVSALDAIRKRALLKLHNLADDEKPPSPPDTRLLGDGVIIDVYDRLTGLLKGSIDKFSEDVVFEGVTYPKGAPMVALTGGMGLSRNTPRFRQLVGNLAQMIVDPADPANYAPHYFSDPLPSSDYDTAEPGANVLLMPTVGDPGVSVATGIAGARAAGLIDIYAIDPRYGKTVNDVLIDNHIIEGLARLRRFNGQEILMDPENFSNNLWRPDAPRLDPPLRLTRVSGTGISALRLPLLDPRGQHCPIVPAPNDSFDNVTFLMHMVSRFIATKGKELREEACQAKQTCSWIPPNSPPAVPPTP